MVYLQQFKYGIIVLRINILALNQVELFPDKIWRGPSIFSVLPPKYSEVPCIQITVLIKILFESSKFFLVGKIYSLIWKYNLKWVNFRAPWKCYQIHRTLLSGHQLSNFPSFTDSKTVLLRSWRTWNWNNGWRLVEIGSESILLSELRAAHSCTLDIY